MGVTAYNSKGQKQVFSDLAWKTLGKNKGDWKERAAQSIENTIIKEPRPDMGPSKRQTLENTLDEGKKEETGKKDETIVDDAAKKASAEAGTKEEFLKAIEGVTANQIKDFFDQETPRVDYKNNAKAAALKTQLAEYFNYDLVKLQKAFL